MTVKISRTAHEAMLETAAADPTREVCGLLFGDVERIDGVTPTVNVAADPSRSFEIEPAALFTALRAQRDGGPQLVGYFHSHPNGLAEPSATDRAMAVPDDRIWIIIASGELTAWRATVTGFVEIRPKTIF